MIFDLTGFVAAVRDSISAWVIQMLLVDCNNDKQIQNQSPFLTWMYELVNAPAVYTWGTLMFSVASCVLLSLTERVLAGADGLVRETISWIARRSLSLCRGLLMPISLWISVSERLAIIAPLFTLARHAATYHAGIPTHSWIKSEKTQTDMQLTITWPCYLK